MANSLSASFRTEMSKEMQLLLQKKAIYRELASFKEEAVLVKGNTVSRPYRSRLVGQTYTRGSAYTPQDLTDTNEQLTVSTTKCVPFYIDKFDEIQHEYSARQLYAEDASIEAQNILDGAFLAETANATYVIDNEDFGGTSGDGLVVSTSNIRQVFTKMGKLMDRANVPFDQRYATISPDFKEVLVNALSDKETALGDSTGLNGNVGRFSNFDLYLTNANYWTGRVELATVPTAGDTVVINGVTLTFRDTGDVNSAGEVYYGANAAAACTNLAAMINAPSTTTAGVTYAVSSTKDSTGYSDQDRLRNVTATAGSTYVTLVVKDEGYIAVSETLTAAADIWTPAKQLQWIQFGRKKVCVDMVVQSKPDIEIIKNPAGSSGGNKLGVDVVPNMLYGVKTFNFGARNMGVVKVNSSGF